MNMAGKGDKPRPVDKKKYRSNYDRIFMTKYLVCVASGSGMASKIKEADPESDIPRADTTITWDEETSTLGPIESVWLEVWSDDLTPEQIMEMGKGHRIETKIVKVTDEDGNEKNVEKKTRVDYQHVLEVRKK
jgi:hypothetical protein